MKKSYIKRLALIMARNCVRDTVIEEYHPRLTQEEMKAFNKQVANKIYTFLCFMYDTSIKEEDRNIFFNRMHENYPDNWDQPELDPSFVGFVRLEKKERKRSLKQSS
jgi:hypothetical protein